MRYVAAEVLIDSSVAHNFQHNYDEKYKYVYKYDI